jgi:hypothetical protein
MTNPWLRENPGSTSEILELEQWIAENFSSLIPRTHRYKSEEIDLEKWRTLTYSESERAISKAARSDFSRRDAAIVGHQAHPRALKEFLSRKLLRLDDPESSKAISRVLNFYVVDRMSPGRFEAKILKSAEVLPLISLERLIGFHCSRLSSKGLLNKSSRELKEETLLRAVREIVRKVERNKSSSSRVRRTPSPKNGALGKKLPYEDWCMNGGTWIRGADGRGLLVPGFLLDIYRLGLSWDETEPSWEPAYDVLDWYSEIWSTFQTLQTSLTFSPKWPMIFESREILIVISESNQRISSWVETKNFKTLLSMSLSSRVVSCHATKSQALFAAGVSLSWFIDCCLNIEASRHHPHFSRKPSESKFVSRLPSTTRRIFPTPHFLDAVSTSRSIETSARSSHEVRGHRRRLPRGQRPSKRALQSAPAHVRKGLKDGETFVRPHGRGSGETAKEIQVRLSRYSKLADVLGGISTS